MTFLLNVIDKGEVHVPLANVIVAVELLNTIPRRPNVLPRLPLMERYEHEKPSHLLYAEL